MKKFYVFLIGLMMALSLSSCGTYTYVTTQDDIYVETDVDIVRSDVSFDIIIRYGTPFYRDGILLYYLYNDLYYYPYYYNNYWYVRAYRRPFTHFDRRPYFRPHRYDYRFSPGQHRGFEKNGVNHHQLNARPPHERRPDVRPNNNERRPNINRKRDNRPTQPNRSVQQNRPTQPNRSVQQNRPTQPNRSVQPSRSSGGNFGGQRMGGRR